MNFVPLASGMLDDLWPLWSPFLADIARRSKEPIKDLLAQVKRNEVQIALVWDGERAHALVGMIFRQRGNELIGEICWLTGKGMKRWRHLLPQMEDYLREKGCAEIKPICRRGWSPFLRTRGYRTTHVIMEKRL